MGVKPKYGWQIDPFGGSSITPTLFRGLGYDAMVHDRISLRLKNQRMLTRELQYLWQGSQNLGEASELFTHVLDNWYWQPSGYNWDEGDPPVTDQNIKSLSDNLVRILKERASYFRTPHILYPFGHDFAFQDAEIMFENMEQLIAYINERNSTYGITVSFSTLADYFDAVNQAAVSWPEFTMDYLPFEDYPWSVGSCFWVGHYTSRPQLKGLARKTDSNLKTAEALFVYGPHTITDLQHGREIAALMNHHDAITGTSKQLVVDDYVAKMRDSIARLHLSIKESVQLILEKLQKPALVVWDEEGAPVSLRQTSAQHPLVIHNSLGWVREEIVRVRVRLVGVPPTSTHGHVNIINSYGESVPSQMVPVWNHEAPEALADLFFPVTIGPLALEYVPDLLFEFNPLSSSFLCLCLCPPPLSVIGHSSFNLI